MPINFQPGPTVARRSSLRVLIVVLALAAMAYGAAITLALTRAAGSTVELILLVAGAVLLPVVLLMVRRRMWAPLTELERGIRRVAEGDLTVQVPLTRNDELGHVTTHFNEMTRVLRDRAEEQGRFAAAGELLAGVEQVVVNLLSNALDALRSVKPPRRLVVDSFVQNDRVCVTVTDNGPGVAAEIAQRLFRPFASTKGRRGTGLGLYISRQLVREAEGDLELTPHGERGARFMAWLPATAASAPPSLSPVQLEAAKPAAPAVPAAPASLAGVRVLLVDDEELIRRPMARF